MCACVYGFNVWSHDKAQTEATVSVCSAIILSITMETSFYLICIWVYQPQRELCHFPLENTTALLRDSEKFATLVSQHFPKS